MAETDWKSIAQELVGALDACVTQIGQMKGMFDDSDGNIEEALKAAADAVDRNHNATGVTPLC